MISFIDISYYKYSTAPESVHCTRNIIEAKPAAQLALS